MRPRVVGALALAAMGGLLATALLSGGERDSSKDAASDVAASPSAPAPPIFLEGVPPPPVPGGIEAPGFTVAPKETAPRRPPRAAKAKLRVEAVDAWGRPVPHVEVVAKGVDLLEESRVKIRFSGTGRIELTPGGVFRLEFVPDSPLFEPAVKEAVRAEEGRVICALPTNAVRVSGVVRRVGAPEPEPHLLLTISGGEARLEKVWCSTGRFDLLVPPGGAHLEATTAGWEGETSLTGDAGAWFQDVEIPLLSTGGLLLEGTVSSSAGEPIFGAKVELSLEEAAITVSPRPRWGRNRVESWTDPDGRFRIRPLLPGTYRLEASARGFVDSPPVSLVVGTEDCRTSVVLEPAARLRLRPLLGDVSSFERGTLRLYRDGRVVRILDGLSWTREGWRRGSEPWTPSPSNALRLEPSPPPWAPDAEGYLAVEDLAPGTYALEFRGDGWGGAVHFTAIAGETTIVDLPLERDRR